GAIAPLENFQGALARETLLAPHAAGAHPVVPESLPGLAQRHQHEILEHGHLREWPRYLKRAGEPSREDTIGGEPVDPLAHEADRAGLGRERARDQVEERRLAGAVRADEPGDGARVDREIDAVDGAQIPECLDESRDLEHDARLWQSTRSRRASRARFASAALI